MFLRLVGILPEHGQTQDGNEAAGYSGDEIHGFTW